MHKVQTYFLALIILFAINLSNVLSEEYNEEPFPTIEIESNIIYEPQVIIEPLERVKDSQETTKTVEKVSNKHNKHRKHKKRQKKKSKKIKRMKQVEKTTTINQYECKDVDSTESVLTPSGGINYNRDGYLETYYNLDMSLVVSNMRNKGFSASEYPYWVRDDGVKMIGEYVIVAADLNIHPRGSTVHTSLGTGLVCDTGSFTESNSYQFDIAVSW